MQKILFVTKSVIRLIHTQTHACIELPINLPVIRFGKANTQIPVDVNLSDFPNSDMVSFMQAEIHREKGLYFIEDMRSFKGTYLNQKRLAIGHRYRLNTDDTISFGEGDLVSFVFKLF